MLITALFYSPLNFHNPVLQRAQTNNNFVAYQDTCLTKDEQETNSTISSTELHMRNQQVSSQLNCKAPCHSSLDDFSYHTITQTPNSSQATRTQTAQDFVKSAQFPELHKVWKHEILRPLKINGRFTVISER